MKWYAPLSICLSLSVSLALGWAAAQAPSAMAGYRAQGTVTLAGPRGPLSGSITVETAGPGYCKVTAKLDDAGGPRTLEIILNGKQRWAHVPAELAALPLPVAAGVGCALLPQGLGAAGAATVSLNPQTGLPQSVAWSERGQGVAVTYGNGDVTESVAGAVRWSVHWDGVTSEAAVTVADFAVPLPPAHAGQGVRP